ncbi:DNA-processing protein DprA [Streptomyces sp. HNM0574]|uniref:DNA-processing protein DprA n=1 Tax=Streptomyces sp. HNM0574 TaxID=2714954 RepID=UPI00146B8AB1|nr:DNA-protecting protein DprA [Streptomyces sp. HNM0574]
MNPRPPQKGDTDITPSEAPEDERLARVALTHIIEPGDDTLGRLLTRIGPEATLDALRTGAPAPAGISSHRWAGLRLRTHRLPRTPQQDLELVARIGGRFICPGDTEWPAQLDDLGPARPIGLWARGTPSLRFCALRSVSVVGARACTDYGAHVASVISAGLARHGWTVISGAAYGIDSAAHRGALTGDGATVGVLACGPDSVYPPGNAELIRRIGEQGLLIGELPPGGHPNRARFILRNRVIAALSRGTLVIEAALRSGSLSTARHARALGRHIMGTPGPVTSAMSSGVHELLREDAVLVTSAAEMIELVGNIGELAPARRGADLPRDALPRETASVLDAFPAHGPADTEHLAHEAALGIDAALARLHELCALGFVERQGDAWQLARPAPRNPNE